MVLIAAVVSGGLVIQLEVPAWYCDVARDFIPRVTRIFSSTSPHLAGPLSDRSIVGNFKLLKGERGESGVYYMEFGPDKIRHR